MYCVQKLPTTASQRFFFAVLCPGELRIPENLQLCANAMREKLRQLTIPANTSHNEPQQQILITWRAYVWSLCDIICQQLAVFAHKQEEEIRKIHVQTLKRQNRKWTAGLWDRWKGSLNPSDWFRCFAFQRHCGHRIPQSTSSWLKKNISGGPSGACGHDVLHSFLKYKQQNIFFFKKSVAGKGGTDYNYFPC